MTEKDLMVGDWIKVIPFNDKKNSINKRIEKGSDIDRLFDFQGYIEAIPITSKILLNNGFIKHEHPGYTRHYTYELPCDGFVFKLFSLYDLDFSFNINNEARNIKNVHELQHVLRLLGIDNVIKFLNKK